MPFRTFGKLIEIQRFVDVFQVLVEQVLPLFVAKELKFA